MQPFFVAFRGKRVIVVLRPDDEGFRVYLEGGLPTAGIAPPDEFDSSVSTELKLSEFARCAARKTKNFLNVPIHGSPQFFGVLPLKLTGQAPLNSVKTVFVAHRTSSDELADEPHADVDDDENRQAYEDENEYDPMENGSLTYPECPVLCEQPLKIRHGSPFRTKCRLRGGSLPR